jgi:hypothetical protein
VVLNEAATVAKEGAKTARVQLEKSTGKPAVSASNVKAIGTRQLSGKKKL